jgi:dCMP deaminase
MSKINNTMKIAEVVAERSHDSETKVGAVLVHNKTGAIIAQGFNGFVRGADDKSLPTTKPDKYPFMVHAEVNLICNAARHGISTDECFVVCTLSPCSNCMRTLWQCGINKVYFRDIYRDFYTHINMGDLKVELKDMDQPIKLLTIHPSGDTIKV